MNQILFKLFFLQFLLLNCSITTFTSAQSYTNRIIHASLSDKDTGRVWQIQEWIHSGNKRTGRIEIKSDDNEASVFYSHGSRDNNKRLVIHENTCDLYYYDLKWDKLLPGVNKPLTNLILLLGPSILDTYNALNWENGNDEIIRGSLMHSASTVLEDKLNITLYYESNLNLINGVKQSSQVVFTGYNPDTLVEGKPENLILDIYLQSQTQTELDKLVQVTPGFGCPVYLNENKEFPELNKRKVHYIVSEKANSVPKVISEIHADEVNQVVRLSELKYGFTRERLYDYSLGINYELSKSSDCLVFPIRSYAPGIDEKGSLSLEKLLWLSKSLRYLGEIIFDHKSGYNVHVWESTEINRMIEDKTYEKVVTTQYLSQSFQKDMFNFYSPVAASIKAYNKDAKGKYVLVYSIYRDYYDSNSDLPESVYHEAFQIADCFAKPEQRLNLKFHLICKDNGCIKNSQDAVYEMRELFKSKLLEHLKISSNRVAAINLAFQQEEIEADVTFLEAPQISEVLSRRVDFVKPQSTTKLHETVSVNSENCLRYHSSFVPSGSSIIYCDDTKLCFSTNDADLKHDTKGTMCSIYVDSYNKLNRLGRETLLSDLHDHILGYLGHITFNMNLRGMAQSVTFQATDVVAQIGSREGKVVSPFNSLYRAHNFNEIDGVHTVMVPGINSFGDCYRACAQDEFISCETFSFCQRKDQKECYVSTWTETEIENNRTEDADCRINVKNYLSNFIVKSHSQFKYPTSVSEEKYKSVCASECYASKDCVSFQVCSSGTCTFGSLVTSSNTEYSDTCDIYTAKSSQKYTITGKKLVSKILYTEVGLDLDQCATLCDDDLSCKSFNFCPKSKSSSQCQITSYSIKDPKTESVETTICHNFELSVITKKDTVSDNSPDIYVGSVSGGGVFGVIISCLFIGLFAGFVGPYVFIKVKSKNTNRSHDHFGWSRQKDCDEDLTTM